MNIDERVRDLMAAYHAAAEADPPGELGVAEMGPESGDEPPQHPHHRWLMAASVAAAAALLVVAVQQLRSGPTAKAASVVVPDSAAYVRAIRAPYQRIFDAGEAWWYVPPLPICREAAFHWDEPSRRQCQASDAEAADVAQQLGGVLARLRPPASIERVHEQLVQATTAVGAAFAAQVDDLIRNDRQAFMDRARPISDALGALCESVTALDKHVRDTLPVDNAWCTG